MSFDHSPHPGFKFHYPGKEPERDGGSMPDHLSGLVKMIVRSLPVEDPHAQQRQQRSIIDLCPINDPEPFGPSDHMGPQLIVKVQVWEDIVPPPMVCSRLVLPLLADPVEGSLGDLSNFSSAFPSKGNEERGYLKCRWVMSPPRQRGILFIAESSNVPKKPTRG